MTTGHGHWLIYQFLASKKKGTVMLLHLRNNKKLIDVLRELRLSRCPAVEMLGLGRLLFG